MFGAVSTARQRRTRRPHLEDAFAHERTDGGNADVGRLGGWLFLDLACDGVMDLPQR
jgi:hypothetical protein